VISVLDDGAGMPPELADAPFEPGHRPGQGNGTSNGNSGKNGSSYRKTAGAGLGLSIAEGIVQAHGGRIELTALRRGTCFSVYLPVEAGNSAPAAAQRSMDMGMPNDD